VLHFLVSVVQMTKKSTSVRLYGALVLLLFIFLFLLIWVVA